MWKSKFAIIKMPFKADEEKGKTWTKMRETSEMGL